ncbi:hypothetical protein ABE178_12175 [Priestia megaterium]
MSYYDKKYIKGDPKKHDYKEDCKEDYKEDCKEDCKKHDHKYHEYHEEEKGLLTEYDVDQSPSVPVSFPGVPSLANRFAEVEVCVDDRGDRVALDLTVDWQPAVLSLVGLILVIIELLTTAAPGTTLPLAVSATFRIWRKSSNGTVLISEKTDTSPLAGISVLATGATTGIVFGETTTSIHAVDTDPSLGENEYFATITAAPVAPGTVITSLVGGALTLVPFSGFTVTPNQINSYTFTAAEIEEND